MPAAIIEFATDEYRIVTCRKEPPTIRAHYRQHTRLIEEFELGISEGEYLFLGVSDVCANWPTLVVEQRFSPCGSGFNPGIMLIRESRVLFIGAGSRLLAYRLDEPPRRLWEDVADVGFWSWSRYGNVVLMSAELELAAWSIEGIKLWTAFVEPPWNYSVSDQVVHLDVMGNLSSFPLAEGPGRAT